LLKSLDPVWVRVEFRQLSAENSFVDLVLKFRGDDAADAIVHLKETLIRSEAELELECEFIKDNDESSHDAEWRSLSVWPDAMALPNGKTIATAVSLLDVAVDALKQAYATDTPLSYSVTLQETQSDPELARNLVPALAELQKGRRNGNLVHALEMSFNLLRQGGWSANEQLCVLRDRYDRDQGWVESLVRQNLQASFGFVPSEMWIFRWDGDEKYREPEPFHERVSRLRTRDWFDQLFNRIVPSDPDGLAFVASMKRSQRSRAAANQGDYAFISYAHANFAFAKALIHRLEEAHVRFWFDASIQPGALWDEKLEERIRNSAVLIACVSDEYQNSKYCRRELKFADVLNKVILPIAPSKWTWGPGLQMMFQELQVAAFENGEGFNDFRRVLEYRVNKVFLHSRN
jgi:uncharacterized protein YbdZ (MbtH family)